MRLPIFDACYNGNFDVVRELIEAGTDINIKDSNGYTLLHIVVDYQLSDQNDLTTVSCREQIIQLLLFRGNCVNVIDRYGATPLHLAAEKGNHWAVKLLLKLGANHQIKDYVGRNAVHFSAESGNVESLNLLFKYGASLDDEDKTGCTALHLAAKSGHFQIVKFLIDNGSDLHRKSEKGVSVLQLAARSGHFQTVKYLIDRGADILCCDDDDRTVLHYSVEGGNNFIINEVLRRGSNARVCDVNGTTPLHLAAKAGNDLSVCLLLGIHHDPCSMSLEDNTEKCNNNKFDDLESLNLAISEDINAVNSYGVAPLHLAAMFGNYNIVKLLLNLGAIPQKKDVLEKTLLHYSAKGGCLEIVKMFVEMGFDVFDRHGFTPLHYASYEGHAKVIEFLLQYMPNIDVRNSRLETSLHLALMRGQMDAIQMLLANGADVHLTDVKSWTALHYACSSGNYNILKLIIRYSPDVNAVAKGGVTPLHVIVSAHKDVDMLKLLLDNGAQPNLQDDCGNTPLHVALTSRAVQVVSTLLDYGADINISTYDFYETPLSVVLTNDYQNDIIRELLVSHTYRLKALNLLQLDSVLESLLFARNESFFSNCVQEVSSMKQSKLNECTSFYQTLIEPFDKLVGHCKCTTTKLRLKKGLYKELFPIYSNMLEWKFNKAIEKVNMLEYGVIFFNCLPNSLPKLLYDCVEIILSYLSIRDLQVLADCCVDLT